MTMRQDAYEEGMMKMQRKEMENDNEARCYEEGMHRRADPTPSSQTSSLISTRQKDEKQHLKLQQKENKASINEKCHPTSPPSMLNKSQ